MTSETNAFLTPADAKRLGYDASDAPKRSCPHCSRELDPLAIPFNGRLSWVGTSKCGCPGEAEAARLAAERAEAERRAERERAHDAMLRSVGIARRYAKAEVDNAQCIRYLQGFADNAGGGLYIHGGVGTGKTTLASALARKFAESGYRVMLTTAIGMLERIQETYGTEASSLAACHGYGECDVLVIDDLGKEGASAWSVMTLFQILNMRYEAMLPTIVTTQYTPLGLVKRLSRNGERETAEAIASRLRGTCEEVRLAGGDRRIK